MPRSPHQKQKLLILADIFKNETDENHTITVAQLIHRLKAMGISVERKTIYDDINTLCLYGIDICKQKSKTTSYYVSSRDFELPELQLLADAVACSKFITERKSQKLISKIESLASNFEAKKLGRQVIVANRVKTINEHIYYNIDKIRQAIDTNMQISFFYYDYNMEKKKQYRREKQRYYLSPYSLAWEDENYYCIGFYEQYHTISNFRIDRMENLNITPMPNIQPEEKFDISEYSRKVFGMFNGEDVWCCLRFHKSLVGAVLDKFGKNIRLTIVDDEHFEITHNITLSPPFFGWLFQFGKKAEVISPNELKEKLKEHALEVIDLYENI